jgi:hypothetical protein
MYSMNNKCIDTNMSRFNMPLMEGGCLVSTDETAYTIYVMYNLRYMHFTFIDIIIA